MIVVKLGGRTFETPEGRARLLAEIASLRRDGKDVVLVHGGGNRITTELAASGVAVRFVRGLRVTDAPTLAIVERVLRGVGREIADGLRAHGVDAVALAGCDDRLVAADLREELGFVGRATHANPGPILEAVRAGVLPVVAPLAVGKQAPVLNVNADEVAGLLAASLPASELLLLTDVDTVFGPDGPIDLLTTATARDLLERGTAKDGMAPKLDAALVAAAAGVTVTIANGNRAGILESALAGVAGTRVVG